VIVAWTPPSSAVLVNARRQTTRFTKRPAPASPHSPRLPLLLLRKQKLTVVGGATTEASTKGLKVNIEYPFYQLSVLKWLHGRPEEDVYKLLIDTYRLRVEDDLRRGIVGLGSCYDFAGNGKTGFMHFLKQVEEKRWLLPDWWSPCKACACINSGAAPSPSSPTPSWSALTFPARDPDIIEHYEDEMMPMQLRLFSDQVFEDAHPLVGAGMDMLQLQVMLEATRARDAGNGSKKLEW
jgi:splicing suppressor protein 51